MWGFVLGWSLQANASGIIKQFESFKHVEHTDLQKKKKKKKKKKKTRNYLNAIKRCCIHMYNNNIFIHISGHV